MMKIYNRFKINIQYCLLVSLVVGVTLSCEDDLDITLKGVPLLETFYKTPKDAEQGLVAAYRGLREMYGRENFLATSVNDFVFGDIGTDDIIKGGARVNDGPQIFEKENYSLPTSNQSVSTIWKVNYKGILFANLILDKVPLIEFEDTDKKKEILAEARFLRAYYYFDLVNTFGGVPLIDRVLSVGEFNVPRATKEKTYKFIEDDLKLAIADLPSRFDRGESSYGHADKGAALGLMMRVSLYQNKMDQVKVYGEQLFELPYELLANFDGIFQPTGEWNKGSIFEVNYSSNSDNLGTGLSRRLRHRGEAGIGNGQIKDNLRAAFEMDDPRLEASFYNKPGGFGTGWYLRKYGVAPYSDYKRSTVGGKSNDPHNVRLIRLADTYLMYAEAIYNTNAPNAVKYVNKVRTRARGANAATVVPNLDVNLAGQPLLDAIYLERRLELAGEGFRYHDLVRTGRAEAILGPLGFKKGTHEVMPIPLDQVTLSQGVLIQNENY